jgi:hypothetical protein
MTKDNEARLQRQNKRLKRALAPFERMAIVLFDRGWNIERIVLALDSPDEANRITAGDFYYLRRAMLGDDHESDCAKHDAPAYAAGACTCMARDNASPAPPAPREGGEALTPTRLDDSAAPSAGDKREGGEG